MPHERGASSILSQIAIQRASSIEERVVEIEENSGFHRCRVLFVNSLELTAGVAPESIQHPVRRAMPARRKRYLHEPRRR
jgi:hypothetical protein